MKHNHLRDERFLFLMATMADQSNQVCTELKERIYAEVLADVPIEALESAVWHITNTRTTASFPKVGEIREALSGGKAQDVAALALAKLEKGISVIGRYNSAVFDDPLIHAAVSLMGGWVKICNMEPEEWKWTRREFEKLYASLSTRPIGELTIPVRLPGIAETHNSAHGLQHKTQIGYYGDKAKIAAWTQDQLEYKAQGVNPEVKKLINHLAEP